MAKKEYTDREIQALKCPPGKTEYPLRIAPLLYIRVLPGGKKEWYINYTSPIGKGRPSLFFGSYPEMSLDAARLKAAEYKIQIKAGIDPKFERDQAELIVELGDAPETVGELALTWKQKELQSHGDQGAYAYRMLELHALPSLGKIALDRVRQPAIATTLTNLKDSGKMVTTGKVLGYLRQMFSYAVERGWLQGDPTAGMSKKKWAGKRKRGQRVLAREEISELSTKCASADLSPEIECAIWLMLAGMTRVEETGLAQLKHIDFDNGTWFIPPDNQKLTASGRRPHWVDLSPFALKWLKRLTELPQERAVRANNRLPPQKRLAVVPTVEVDFLFPAQKRPGGINEKTIAHAMNDRQRPGMAPHKGRTPLVDSLVLPGGKWTPHDLRRTASTFMRELGTPQDVIERCLNHVEGDDLVATYQHAKLRPEMRAAWLKLGELLESLTQRQPSDVKYIESMVEEVEEDI